MTRGRHCSRSSTTSHQGRNSISRRALEARRRWQRTSKALCEAGANIIVDDIGYTLEAAFQDDIVAKGVNAAVADGCDFFSAGGNDGNLTYGTTGVWEGDYAAGTSLIVDGETLGVRHVFGGGVEAKRGEWLQG